MCVHVCACACMEVKEQLAEVSSLLVGPMDYTQVVRSEGEPFQPAVISLAPLFKTGQWTGSYRYAPPRLALMKFLLNSFLDPTETLRGKE